MKMHRFFSIGQYQQIIKKVHDRCNQQAIPVPTLTFKGTVKLHGTNSSIYNELATNEIICQSRNNVISVEKDNEGFAQFIEKNKTIVEQIFTEMKRIYPHEVKDKTAVVYGEWCGGSIQGNVALTQLKKMFVIFGIKLIPTDSMVEDDPNIMVASNEIWLSEDEIQHIKNKVGQQELEQCSIYSIYDFPTFDLNIDMVNPKLKQNELVEITLAVEKECPVAKKFGISGVGEGVVWRCVSYHPSIQTNDLIFKVKGKDHSVTHVKSIAPVDVEKVNSIKEYVTTVVTENRLKQGLEYLKEQHLEENTKNIGVFLKWVANDCLKEEKDRMDASNLEVKEVMPAISNYAKQWFLQNTTKK